EEQLLQRRIVLVTGRLDDDAAAKAALLVLDARADRPIELHLDSSDGVLGAAFVLIDTADTVFDAGGSLPGSNRRAGHRHDLGCRSSRRRAAHAVPPLPAHGAVRRHPRSDRRAEPPTTGTALETLRSPGP